MNRRIKIERKLVIAPSMQLFKVDESGPAQCKDPKSKARLKHIQEQFDQMPPEDQQIKDAVDTDQDSDDESVDNKIKSTGGVRERILPHQVNKGKFSC